jgi:hypothetical protein
MVFDASCPQGNSSVVRVLIGNALAEARVGARGIVGKLEDGRRNL